MIGYFDNQDVSTPVKRDHGGGFIPESAAWNSPSSKKPGNINPSLRPVTIKQLNEATQLHAEGVFRIEDQDVNQVSLVASIRQRTNQPSGYSFMLEDGTGCLEGRKWSESQTDSPDGNADPLEEGTWVRVIGSIRAFGGKKSLNIYDVRPLDDYNELMYHFASCLLVHSYRVTGKYVTNINPSKFAGSGMGAPMEPLGAYGQHSAQRVVENGSEMSTNQRLIYNLFYQCKENEGLNIDTACLTLKGQVPPDETRNIYEWLVEEGHLYNTIDDKHAKSTAS